MTAHVSFPKPETFRSRKLREAIARLECMNCGRERYGQHAHENQDKGMGIKSSDACGMALCITCHVIVDRTGTMPKEERRAFETLMVKKTLVALIERGVLVLA